MNVGVSVLGGGLLAVLWVATAGNAGSQPHVLLAWHGLLLLIVLFSWTRATTSGTGRRPAAGASLALTVLALVVVAGYAQAPYTYAAWLTRPRAG